MAQTLLSIYPALGSAGFGMRYLCLCDPRTITVSVNAAGRTIDHINRKLLKLQDVQFCVLDEADEMVNAFKDNLDQIIKDIPKAHRTLVFTATLSGAVKQLVQNYMSKHVLQIEAETAYWVIGGSKMGVMTARAKWAFESKESADAFMKQFDQMKKMMGMMNKMPMSGFPGMKGLKR